MCNIITYQFACPHRVRRRRSPCHGAKAKPASSTTAAPRVACVAECFLTVYLRAPCNECNHKIWDTAWQAKVSRADAYLDDLKEQYNSTEAVQTIEALRQEVEERRKAEEWALRHSITLLPVRHVPRVKHQKFARSPSSLGVEVKAEDVHEGEKAWKDWSEMKEEDYDDDYVASTDPIHPVTTDYKFPGEDDDDEWVKQYLADGAEHDGAEGGDSTSWDETGGWDWGDGDDKGGGTVQGEEDWKEERFIPVEEQLDVSEGGAHSAHKITNTAAPSSSATHPTSTQGNKINEAELDSLIASFWSHFNFTTSTDPNMSPHSLSSPHPEPPSPPPTTPPWIDGTHDSPSTIIPILASTPQPLSANRNPRRTHYDKQRHVLTQRKNVDEKKFYREWLILSRCEIREYEGLGEGGRRVVEPSS